MRGCFVCCCCSSCTPRNPVGRDPTNDDSKRAHNVQTIQCSKNDTGSHYVPSTPYFKLQYFKLHCISPRLSRRDIGAHAGASYTSVPPLLSRLDIGALVCATYTSVPPLFCLGWTSGLVFVQVTPLYLPSCLGWT